MKDKNYHNYYDQNFTEKLEKKVNEVFRDHFAEFEENINNTAITEYISILLTMDFKRIF